ncbi:MAG: DUF1003 domain-containing protein [Chthoniobacteraceae bacterium]
MDTKSAPADGSTEPETSRVLDRNIHALLRRRLFEDRRRPLQERIADRVTAFAGSMVFVFVHLALFGGWVAANLPGVPWARFDPTFVVLAMVASVEAIFLSTFVLITQNRMAVLAEKRNELNLQISLLAEHEVTRLIQLVTQMAAHMEIQDAHNPDLEELKRDVAPERVLETLERVGRSTAEEDPAR